MADRITKSVRRIVRSMDDDPVGLASADQRKTIGTSRGEAYINSRGDVTSSGNDGGSDIDKQPGSGTPPTDDADDKDTGGSGGKNDGTTPPDAVSGDAADVDDALVLDAKAGPVTGTDPTTANFTSVNFDSLAGIEYTPPNGWEGPDSPPPTEGWEQGFEWAELAGQGFGDYAAKSLVAADAGATLIANGYSLLQDTSTSIAWFKTVPPFYDAGLGAFGTYSWQKQACTPGSSISCPVNDPSADDDWPTDGECSVAYDHDEGGYKGHERDVDCSAAQKTPSTCVIIRSQTQSSRYFRYCRLSTGGTKITEVDSGGVPVPGTITKILDESGRVTDFVDVALDPKYT